MDEQSPMTGDGKTDETITASGIGCTIAALALVLVVCFVFWYIFDDLAFPIILALIVLSALASIPAGIASKKGYSFGGYWLFGFFFFLPALIVALVVSDKADSEKLSDSDVKYHVPVGRKDVGESWRETWTCPECGKRWYVKGSARIAKCGNADCGCRVFLERD